MADPTLAELSADLAATKAALAVFVQAVKSALVYAAANDASKPNEDDTVTVAAACDALVSALTS